MLFNALYNLIAHIRYRTIVSGDQYTIRKNASIKGRKGHITLGKVLINENAFICCSNKGIITIEDNVTINRNTIIVSKESISIGQGTSIGPNVCIYDHNHQITNDGFKKNEFSTSQITIGKNVWIGANVCILKGSQIGDNSVISAGAVISFFVPSNSIVKNRMGLEVEKLEINHRKPRGDMNV